MKTFLMLIVIFLAVSSAYGQQVPNSPQPPACDAHSNNNPHVSVCTLNIQAGIPYKGRIAEWGSCGPYSVGGFVGAVIWEPGQAQVYTPADDANGYLLDSHVYSQPGDYTISVGFEINCFPTPNTNNHVVCSTGTPCSKQGAAHVTVPMAPASIYVPSH